MTTKIIEIRCAFCHAVFRRDEKREEKNPIRFCAYCGAKIGKEELVSELDKQAIFLKEHAPQPSEIIGSIGRFLLIKSIGRGGMGEIFLAFDTVCGRRVALKRIRPDLMHSPQLRRRFIREARITSQLIHPGIIPIYDIHINKDSVYYTMPLLEGKTLKQIIRDAIKNEESFAAHEHKTSIPTLIRLFLGVLQAVAYAHSKGVLHRDLKPENIIIGTYGQVIILDWGLTKLLEEIQEETLLSTHVRASSKLTRMEKPVGTVAYMAPERVQGKPASKQTDIYALGVILYQILTLRLPFSRKNMKTFVESWKDEQFVPPEIRAPYRDVPQALSEIVKQCLASDPQERYRTCDQLLSHIESFLEGRSEWFVVKSLDIFRKEDWKFQENVLFSEHTAISRSTELGDWFNLMFSKESFSENIRLDITVRLGPFCHGFGCILCAPSRPKQGDLTAGYWLWLAANKEGERRTTLLRSSVPVLEAPEIMLTSDTSYHIRIEKIEQTIILTINDTQQFVYTSHIPVVGTHVGMLIQDTDIDIESFTISIGSQNIMVNCLAVPDAFLTSHDFARALAEYRRIGNAFSGRAEGREALFRAGVTLLEKAKREYDPQQRDVIFDLARQEFHKLRHTPGAPLEYLGKALVYHTTQEFDEEIKCFELAFRRYKRHPLLRVLVEQVILRMHESSRQHRVAAYHFIYLVLRFLPDIASKTSSKKIFESVEKHWEPLPFLSPASEEHKTHHFCITLAFWLQKTYIISEIFEECIAMPFLPINLICEALLLLFLLGGQKIFSHHFSSWQQSLSSDEKENHSYLLQTLSILEIEDSKTRRQSYQPQFKDIEIFETKIMITLMEEAIQEHNYKEATALFEQYNKTTSSLLYEELASKAVEAYLWIHDFQKAQEIFNHFSQKRLCNEECRLFFLYGCFLTQTKSNEAAMTHFEQAIDTAYPRSWLIGAYVITGKILIRPHGWFLKSFKYEQHQLLRQLQLYTYLSGDLSYVSIIEFLQEKIS